MKIAHQRSFLNSFHSSLTVALLFTAMAMGSCNLNQKDASVKSDDTTSLVADFRISPQADTAIFDRKFEQVPSIAASLDGNVLYVAWYSGGDAPGPGNFVTVSTSTDRGETWSNDQLIVYPKSPAIRIFDPALWRDNSGQVRLYYGSAGDSLVWDGVGGVNSLNINMKGSEISISDPIRLTDGVMSNKPVYVNSKKFSLFPIYVDKPADGRSSGTKFPENGAFLYSNDNKGLTKYSMIALPDTIRIHDEPQIVEISPEGGFLALLRTTLGIYAASSTDYGKTWSDPKPFTASGPTTSSRFYIGKLASGNLLLVSNNSTTRNNMTASLSKDGGKTWPYQLLLDSRENVSYPDADQTPDGALHVVFDRDRTGAMDILYCRFTEEDILKGLKENVFMKRVNK